MNTTNLTKQQAVVALREVAEAFFTEGFTHGEDRAYNNCFKEVARLLEVSTLSESCRFTVDSCSLKLIPADDKEVTLFGLYPDTFTNPNNVGLCPQYCNEYLCKFRGSLEILEALFK